MTTKVEAPGDVSRGYGGRRGPRTWSCGSAQDLVIGGAAGQRASDILRSPVEQPDDLGGGVALDARKRAGAFGALRLELAFPLALGQGPGPIPQQPARRPFEQPARFELHVGLVLSFLADRAPRKSPLDTFASLGAHLAPPMRLCRSRSGKGVS